MSSGTRAKKRRSTLFYSSAKELNRLRMKRAHDRGRPNRSVKLSTDVVQVQEESSHRGGCNETTGNSSGPNLDIQYSRRAREGSVVEENDSITKVSLHTNSRVEYWNSSP